MSSDVLSTSVNNALADTPVRRRASAFPGTNSNKPRTAIQPMSLQSSMNNEEDEEYDESQENDGRASGTSRLAHSISRSRVSLPKRTSRRASGIYAPGELTDIPKGNSGYGFDKIANGDDFMDALMARRPSALVVVEETEKYENIAEAHHHIVQQQMKYHQPTNEPSESVREEIQIPFELPINIARKFTPQKKARSYLSPRTKLVTPLTEPVNVALQVVEEMARPSTTQTRELQGILHVEEIQKPHRKVNFMDEETIALIKAKNRPPGSELDLTGSSESTHSSAIVIPQVPILPLVTPEPLPQDEVHETEIQEESSPKRPTTKGAFYVSPWPFDQKRIHKTPDVVENHHRPTTFSHPPEPFPPPIEAHKPDGRRWLLEYMDAGSIVSMDAFQDSIDSKEFMDMATTGYAPMNRFEPQEIFTDIPIEDDRDDIRSRRLTTRSNVKTPFVVHEGFKLKGTSPFTHEWSNDHVSFPDLTKSAAYEKILNLKQRRLSILSWNDTNVPHMKPEIKDLLMNVSSVAPKSPYGASSLPHRQVQAALKYARYAHTAPEPRRNIQKIQVKPKSLPMLKPDPSLAVISEKASKQMPSFVFPSLPIHVHASAQPKPTTAARSMNPNGSSRRPVLTLNQKCHNILKRASIKVTEDPIKPEDEVFYALGLKTQQMPNVYIQEVNPSPSLLSLFPFKTAESKDIFVPSLQYQQTYQTLLQPRRHSPRGQRLKPVPSHRRGFVPEPDTMSDNRALASKQAKKLSKVLKTKGFNLKVGFI